MAKLAALVISFLALFVFAELVFAENLLLNPSFEDTTGGSPNSWTKNVSTATLSTSTTAKAGTVSASINKTNSTTGLIYLYQDIDVEPDAFYSLSGYAIKNSPNFSWVILRISWRSSSGEISQTDSPRLTSDSSDFQSLKIDSVQAPSQAIKARIELAANIVTANPNNPALFDDVDFSQIPAPNQPTSTLAPMSSPTPLKSPSPTPTALPKSPTPSPLKSPAPAPQVLAESSQSAAPSASPSSSPASNQQSPLDTIKNNPKTALILVGSGLILIGLSSAFYVWYSKLLGKGPIKNAEGTERSRSEDD
ncbi:MAG: hypothetical protein Q7S45_03890 [Candidatus Curtissbacteria bacterium]|nr:hypothetical protein [Candidatus Curtissbacteria bacterium]